MRIERNDEREERVYMEFAFVWGQDLRFGIKFKSTCTSYTS